MAIMFNKGQDYSALAAFKVMPECLNTLKAYGVTLYIHGDQILLKSKEQAKPIIFVELGVPVTQAVEQKHIIHIKLINNFVTDYLKRLELS